MLHVEVIVKKNIAWSGLILWLIFGAIGCQSRERRADGATSTISPATPAPAPAEQDTALTQTVEIGEERSPNEGGGMTEEEPPLTTTTTASSDTTGTQ